MSRRAGGERGLEETAQVAELTGGPSDGDQVLVTGRAERIIRLGHEYERTGCREVESSGGVTIHFFTHRQQII